MSSTSSFQSNNLDWLRSTIVDIFPGLSNNPKTGTSHLTHFHEDDTNNDAVDLSSCRQPHDINPSTFELTEHHRNEIMGKLFNMMKISEMRRYNISILYHGLVEYFPYLTESDFEVLITSYWCNGEHFGAMVRCRGVRLFDNVILRLEISDELLDRAMSCGASFCKLKAMLIQKRRDTFARYPTEDKHKTLKRVRTSERKFFKRNCCLRFWNHEVLISTFYQLGWLSPELAQIGLNKFLTYVGDRLIAHGMCAHTRREEETMIEQIATSFSPVAVSHHQSSEDDPNEPREESQRSRRMRASINSVMPNSSADDSNEGVRRLLVSYADVVVGRPPIAAAEEEEERSRPSQDMSEQIGDFHDRSMVSLSQRNLRKWMNLLELTTSRGALFSLSTQRISTLRLDGRHRLHVSCSPEGEIVCSDCSCLMGAITRGENTFVFLNTTVEIRNSWLSSLSLQIPKDLWNIVDLYV